jgi:hypothetical protein
VPAHVGITGNEEADRVAKLKASQQGQNKATGAGTAPPTLIQLASVVETLRTGKDRGEMEETLGEYNGGEAYQMVD